MTDDAQDALAALADPALSLRAYGKVHDQASGREVSFDPFKLTNRLQETLLAYFSNPPRTEHGQTKWLTLLGYRQGGKSLTAELCAYTKTAYTPGWDHVCIADTKARAEYLHQRVHFCHARWPEAIRSPTVPNREVRQLTFSEITGGKMRVLSGESGAVGIGQSPDSFHGSELPYWANAGEQFTLIYPSMINRDHSLMVLESTPAPMDAPSAEWWHDQCRDAKRGLSRHLYAFFPFWDSKLNRRPWPNQASLDLDEIKLLDRYAHLGLDKENLAFRRLMLDVDPEIRRNPDLFGVYYPFDDVTCWVATSNSVIHPSLLRRHREQKLVEWVGPYQEYEPPEVGAVYVIGVDPAGYAARDHAAFQVLKVYDGDWTQVACFADHTEPIPFSRKILQVARKYNNATVAVESNGVGAAVLALLEEMQCKNMYYEKPYRPGITATSKSVDQMLSWLQEALRDELTLHDADTVDQLTSYKHDKRVERGASHEILYGGGGGKRRRNRHHWDKISALQMAVTAARKAPRRVKQMEDGDGTENVVLFRDMSWDQVEAYRKEEVKRKGQTKGRRRARYRRKR
tara:strand:+ start:4864 stop:6576 length:1713 start_codon:yes stop_codon:yes gene_type:complete